MARLCRLVARYSGFLGNLVCRVSCLNWLLALYCFVSPTWLEAHSPALDTFSQAGLWRVCTAQQTTLTISEANGTLASNVTSGSMVACCCPQFSVDCTSVLWQYLEARIYQRNVLNFLNGLVALAAFILLHLATKSASLSSSRLIICRLANSMILLISATFLSVAVWIFSQLTTGSKSGAMTVANAHYGSAYYISQLVLCTVWVCALLSLLDMVLCCIKSMQSAGCRRRLSVKRQVNPSLLPNPASTSHLDEHLPVYLSAPVTLPVSPLYIFNDDAENLAWSSLNPGWQSSIPNSQSLPNVFLVT